MTPSKHVQLTLPWRCEMVRRRQGRKQDELHEPRQRQLAVIDEERNLAASHLWALKEQLRLKTYKDSNDGNIVDELQE